MLEDPNFTLKQMNVLFTTPEREEYENISEKNLKEITDRKNCLLKRISSYTNSASEESQLNKYLELKQTILLNEVTCSETNAKVESLKTQLGKKEKVVLNTQTKLKDLTERLEKLKIENENLSQSNQVSFKLFKKALKLYTRYFQFDIQTNDANQENTDTVKINFIVEKNQSPCDIIFYFDKQTHNLLDFSANDMTQEQHEILLSRFKRTTNYLALFCTLRSFVLQKTLNL